MTKNKVNPGKGYRLLKDGDFIKEGDDGWDGKRWFRSTYPGSVIGVEGCTNFIYRRKVESPKGWNVTFKSRKEARYAVMAMKHHEGVILRGPHKAQ